MLNRCSVHLIVSLVALVGCGGAGKGGKTANDASGHAEVGKPAPELSVETVNGKGKVSLEALQGKVVIVDFWATWCAPCKQSFPKLEELSKKVGDRVEIIGISVDDEKAGVAEFAKENGSTFAIGWDQGHTIASKWKVGTMPTTFVVDTTGKVRYIHDGYHEGETKVMEKEVATLVDEAPSGTRVAKNEKDEPKTEPKDAKVDVTEEPKPEAKPEAPAAQPTEEEKPEASAAPAAKKKGGKKGGKAPAKPAAKKPAKKK
ncbi:MAG TPA: TlpA disulfide reductase family protein [Labilithrix sp.]|nr:TlpA disulfide reductase family protein [Labilithrix sp.]